MMVLTIYHDISYWLFSENSQIIRKLSYFKKSQKAKMMVV